MLVRLFNQLKTLIEKVKKKKKKRSSKKRIMPPNCLELELQHPISLWVCISYYLTLKMSDWQPTTTWANSLKQLSLLSQACTPSCALTLALDTRTHKNIRTECWFHFIWKALIFTVQVKYFPWYLGFSQNLLIAFLKHIQC